LVTVNQQAINLLEEVRAEFESESTPIVISGCIGSRDDGYNPVAMMSVGEAESYHNAQIETFKNTNVDLVSALTMSYIDEAIGIVRAAQSAGLPVVISFTVETDGRLPSEVTLKEAVESVDQATGSSPVYYMINCAHPTHFADELVLGEDWVTRVRGLRANASDKSHAELDETVSFKIIFENTGDVALTGVKIVDILPSCLEYAGNADPVEPIISGNKLIWNYYSLSPGDKKEIEFDAVTIESGEKAADPRQRRGDEVEVPSCEGGAKPGSRKCW